MSKDGDALALNVLGHDIEDMEPTLLRALEKRFGVVSARAEKREQERHEREQLVAALESTGTLEVASEGVRAVISGLSLPELKGTATQRQHASDVRAAELQGFIAAQLRQLAHQEQDRGALLSPIRPDGTAAGASAHRAAAVRRRDAREAVAAHGSRATGPPPQGPGWPELGRRH